MPRVLGLVATTAILLAACGGAASPVSVASATPAPTPTATVAASPSASAAAGAASGSAVAVQGFKFLPATLDIPLGTTVTWTNKDTSAHTVTSGSPSAKDGKFDGALDPTSGIFAFTFAAAGTYQYFCARHPTSMLATIVVK